MFVLTMPLNRGIIALRHLLFSTIERIGRIAVRPFKPKLSAVPPLEQMPIRGAGKEEAQQQLATVLGQGRLIHHLQIEKPT